MKQAIIIRTDLKMEKGKIAAQCAHASIASFLKSTQTKQDEWLDSGMAKIVLKVQTKEELKEIFRKAKGEGLKCAIITDAAKTQLKEPSQTAVGIGPDTDGKIDKIVGKLKLL
ncbi:MAG: aminoacyl-tRNA hydrolase [Nanoarchaeota archaeon]|nr:aminoacyl-tRNA hydrolase [Nanoarchaeota archaeon]